jgi:hypothetical protein
MVATVRHELRTSLILFFHCCLSLPVIYFLGTLSMLKTNPTVSTVVVLSNFLSSTTPCFTNWITQKHNPAY